jgi:Host cell surface-exposed lipoprotein
MFKFISVFAVLAVCMAVSLSLVSGASAATPGQKNALRSAQEYLQTEAFSRSGLIHQLKFEGYTTAQATYGVIQVHANWSAEAAKSAKEYLQSEPFSRSGLIQQLRFEGYTLGQATYGVNRAGL